MSRLIRYIGGYEKIEREEIVMTDNALRAELLNDFLKEIGGMVMKAFKTLIGLVKRAFGESYRTADFYSRGEKRYRPVFETTESYYYLDQMIKKSKPVE
jgi:hypothetical protein